MYVKDVWWLFWILAEVGTIKFIFSFISYNLNRGWMQKCKLDCSILEVCRDMWHSSVIEKESPLLRLLQMLSVKVTTDSRMCIWKVIILKECWWMRSKLLNLFIWKLFTLNKMVNFFRSTKLLMIRPWCFKMLFRAFLIHHLNACLEMCQFVLLSRYLMRLVL